MAHTHHPDPAARKCLEELHRHYRHNDQLSALSESERRRILDEFRDLATRFGASSNLIRRLAEEDAIVGDRAKATGFRPDSRFDSVHACFRLNNLYDEIAASAKAGPSRRPALGTLPTGDINAWTIPVEPRTAGPKPSVIVFHSGLSPALGVMAKLAARGMRVTPLGTGAGVLPPPAGVAPPATDREVLLDLLLGYSESGDEALAVFDPSIRFTERWSRGGRLDVRAIERGLRWFSRGGADLEDQVAAHLQREAELFALAHEYGHVVLHSDNASRASEQAPDGYKFERMLWNWEREQAADRFAISTTMPIAVRRSIQQASSPAGMMWALLGAELLLTLAELVSAVFAMRGIQMEGGHPPPRMRKGFLRFYTVAFGESLQRSTWASESLAMAASIDKYFARAWAHIKRRGGAHLSRAQRRAKGERASIRSGRRQPRE